MSVFLKGVTFKDRFVRPQEDAALMAAICADGLYGGCQVSYSGAALKLSPGRIIACGRISVVDTETSISVTGAGSYARLVLTLDMSRSATTSAFEQAALDVEVAAAQNDFAELTQGDINSGATVYQLEICRVTLSNGSISGILWTCGQAHGRAGGVLVILPRAGWSGNRQTVRCDGTTADNIIEACGAPASISAYRAADVRIVGQSAGCITFSCASVPGADLQVNVRLS